MEGVYSEISSPIQSPGQLSSAWSVQLQIYWPISDAGKYSNIEKFCLYSSQLVATWLNAVQLCLELDFACVQINSL